MAKVKLSGYRCDRCGHEWVPREKDADPRVCPKCKSPYWDVPRRDLNKAALAALQTPNDEPIIEKLTPTSAPRRKRA